MCKVSNHMKCSTNRQNFAHMSHETLLIHYYDLHVSQYFIPPGDTKCFNRFLTCQSLSSCMSCDS